MALAAGCLGQSPSPAPKSDDAERPQPRPRVRLTLPAEPSTSTTKPSDEATTRAPRTFEIPDGTPIRMRLGQPVHGITRTLFKINVYSREGDIVRLVAADDVRVNGMVVIPKGARGQAVITNVPLPSLTPAGGTFQKGAAIELFIPKTGTVSLELDWVEDVTGEKVPLRALPTGESKPFVMSVWAENGGIVMGPGKFKKDLKRLVRGHLRDWAPTGTHLTAFVDGATSIDPEEAKDSQELLPVPNENGIVTIYRTKGQLLEHVHIFCDEKEDATLGELQYFSFEVAPGKHSCHIGQQTPLEFIAEAGEERFLHVRHKSGKSSWELVAVGIDEGEDGTANGEIVEAVNTAPVNQ